MPQTLRVPLNYLSIVLLLTGLGGLALVPTATAQPPGMQMLPTVQVAPAEERTIAESLEFSGSVDPWRIIELSAQVAGYVEKAPVEEGEWLEPNEMVCALDTEAVRLEIKQAEAELEAARAELQRLEAGYRTEEIEEARREVEEAQATFERARDEWERQQPLMEQGVISETEGLRVQAEFLVSQASLARSAARLARLEAGYRTEEIAVQRAEVAKQGAIVADAKRRYRRHSIETPVASALTERLKEPGEWVNVGEAVARLVVLDPLKVRIDLPQVYLNKVQRGYDATIRIDGFEGRRFHAQVSSIVPKADTTTRNFPVLLRMENPDHLLRSGLFARVMLSLGEEKPQIVVPREAILIRGEALVVQVAQRLGEGGMPGAGPPMGPPQGQGEEEGQAGGPPEGGEGGTGGPGGAPSGGGDGAPPSPDAIIREAEVTLGTEVDNMVVIEVVKGQPIEPGDPIIVFGGSRLSAGTPVKILPGPIPQGPRPAAEAGTSPPETTSTTTAEQPAEEAS